MSRPPKPSPYDQARQDACQKAIVLLGDYFENVVVTVQDGKEVYWMHFSGNPYACERIAEEGAEELRRDNAIVPNDVIEEIEEEEGKGDSIV